MVKFPQHPHILDRYARPIVRPSQRRRIGEQFATQFSEQQKARRILATYDAAGSSDEYKNYWAPADALDADSANSPAVRAVLVKRARYDIANNGYSDGIASTYCTDLIGIGPTLRMQTGSEGFNRMVELAWYEWCQEIKFRRKLWCTSHAKHQDGEGFGVLRKNQNLQHRVKLDWVLHETEQCQTPYVPYGEAGRIDGVKFDEFGNPVFYDFLRTHPGSNLTGFKESFIPEQVPAKYVTHWFKLRRPGQHRGIPECSSTLNLGAASRRWREATVAAAENIAEFSLFIKTQFEPDEMDTVAAMATLDIQKRMMTALPAGYDAFQPKAEQPTAGHAEFNKALINEQARPISMPLNKAMANSADYNYASGRLDHQTYYGHLDVDREDCNDCVLDPIFAVWFDQAIVAYGWLGGNPDALSPKAKAHMWDWPKHQVADIGTEADAADKKLKNGTSSIAAEHIASGLDPEDELLKTAESHGVTVEQQRQINMLLNLPQHVIPIVAQILKIVPEPTAPAFNSPSKTPAASVEAHNRPGDHPGGGSSGGKTNKKTSGTRTKAQPMSAKAKRAKEAHVMVDRAVQQEADVAERALAKSIGGASFKNSEPVDIVVAGRDGAIEHGIEHKYMFANSNAKITMNKYAQVRKVEWEKKNKATFHTVVESQSGDIYYRRGVGSFRVGGMHKVTGGKSELTKLMRTADSSLPAAAMRTDQAIRSGTWKPTADGRGYANSKTGEVVRPKK